MSIPQESNSIHEENQEEQNEEVEPPTHHPYAPPHELFDISTTVDPSYVISMIRKLLPSEVKDSQNALESDFFREEEEPKRIEGVENNAINLSENGGEYEAAKSFKNCEGEYPKSVNDNQIQSGLVAEETWEECGCILWDLASSEEHAQLMVQNLILEVLSANLMISQSSRITEINLGIIGNLSCHENSRKQISSSNGLVRAIVDQLFLDDVPTLCEACRAITLCLQGGECVIWAEAIQDEQILSRILWISENALNTQLIEKSVGLLLAVLEGPHEVSATLIPTLMRLDLSRLLINLLTFEMNKLKEERISERYTVLDIILRTLEALSVIDDYSHEICLNKELLHILQEMIKIPDKFEIASSCVSAAVLIANIFADMTDLDSEISEDLSLLQGLFDVFPFASDDTNAQNAIWSVISRLLTLVQQSEMSPSILYHLVSILVGKLDLIEEEILADPMCQGELKDAIIFGTTVDAKITAMLKISSILTQWKLLDDEIKNTLSMDDNYINEKDVEKLLNCCRKASRLNLP